MAEYVLLDSAPLSSACRNPRHPAAAHCRQWIDALLARGVLVAVPEIADFEVRRELTRVGAVASLNRLDALVRAGGLIYVPVTTVDWRQAAMFWADARRLGVPTAHPHALDADAILAACAVTIGQPGDSVLVATTNTAHLARYCDARLWTTIV
jgi:predicted nucleic acid-binding protein